MHKTRTDQQVLGTQKIPTSSIQRYIRITLPILIGITALSVPPLFLRGYLLDVVILIVFWSFLGSAWNLLSGLAGQFSFGHAAFFGIGAYTSTVLLVRYGINPWVGMLFGAGLAALAGSLLGFLCWRYGVRGPYFALTTFAFAEVLRLFTNNWTFTNRSLGLQVPLIGGNSLLAFQFELDKRPYYWIIVAFLLMALGTTIFIERSRTGYFLRAIRDDEDAAAALGIPIMRYKIVAMAVSAALTAMGGTFYAQYMFYIDPTIVFGAHVSVDILMRPLVGGVGTPLGPVIGGILLTPLGEVARALVRTPPEFLPFADFIRGRSGLDGLLLGIILIIVILKVPQGVIGWCEYRWRQR